MAQKRSPAKPFAALGASLLRARRTVGLTRAAVHSATGVAGGVLQRYESGDREPPASTLTALAGLYAISVSELLTPNGATSAPAPKRVNRVSEVPPKVYGANVQRRRLELEMSPGELKAALNLPTTDSVLKLEAGRASVGLREQLLPKLVKALKTSRAAILDYHPPPLNRPDSAEPLPASEATETLMSIVEDARRLADRLLVFAARTADGAAAARSSE